MSSRKRSTKANLDFVDDGSDENTGPQTKRTKTSTGTTKAKASSATPNTDKQVDDEGNTFWELGGKLRRVTVSKFKGSVFVNIREHYEKDGKVLPGKKGISLSVEQFNAMMNVLPQLHATLSKESTSEILKPAFGPEAGSSKNGKTEVGDEEEEEEEQKPKTTTRKEATKEKPRSKKAVDSEEESDEEVEDDG